MRTASLAFVLCVSIVTVLFAQEPPGEQDFTTSQGSSLVEQDNLYKFLPIGVALLSLTAGVVWHRMLVTRSAGRWRGNGSRESFFALCGPPIILSTTLLLGVAGIFAWIAFGPAAFADEWPLHARTAYQSLAVAFAIAYLPWLATLGAWRNA